MIYNVPAFDRTQMMVRSWDSFVDPESVARLIDAFVDSLKREIIEARLKEARLVKEEGEEANISGK